MGSSNYRPSASFLYEVASHVKKTAIPAIIIIIAFRILFSAYPMYVSGKRAFRGHTTALSIDLVLCWSSWLYRYMLFSFRVSRQQKRGFRTTLKRGCVVNMWRLQMLGKHINKFYVNVFMVEKLLPFKSLFFCL